MKVVLFTIGDFPVRSYGLVVATAILLAIGVACYLAKETPFRNHVMDMSLYVILGAILGARFWEVFFFQWGYYSQHPGQILAIWNGGMSIQGGLIGGFLAAALYTRLAPAIVFG